MSKTLLLNHHGLGEVLMSLPACRWLVSEIGSQNVWITIVGPEKQICTDQRCGDNFLPFNFSRKNLISTAKLLWNLRKLHFDNVVAFYGFEPKMVGRLSRLIGAHEWFCQAVDEKELFNRETVHKRIRYLRNIETFLGKFFPAGQENDFLLDNIHQFQYDFSDNSKDYIVLVPGSGEMERFKRWPVEHFVSFAKLFIQKFPKMKIVVTGSVAESELTETIQKKVGSHKVINLGGKLDLQQLTSIFHNSKLVIGGDCGGLHLAKAAGARVVAIMGPTNSALTGPIETDLIIDKKLPGTPWYCRKTLKEKAYLVEEPSMQIHAAECLLRLYVCYVFHDLKP